jgi:hypothetical protein
MRPRKPFQPSVPPPQSRPYKASAPRSTSNPQEKARRYNRAVHEEFLVIDEYREVIAINAPGADRDPT